MCHCDNNTDIREMCFTKCDEKITDDLLSCPQLPYAIAWHLWDCREYLRDVESDPVPQFMDMFKFGQEFDNFYVRLKLNPSCPPWALRILIKEIESELRKINDNIP